MALDTSQLRAIFDTHGPMVFQRARRILGNDADAEEAVQEVFVRAFRSADGYQTRASVATWLYSITTNWCLNKIRDRKRRRELWTEKVEPATPTSSGALRHEEIIALRRVLAEADEREAQAAICVYLDGMSHEETAEVLGVSRRTVGNLVERFAAFARRGLTNNTAHGAEADAEVVESGCQGGAASMGLVVTLLGLALVASRRRTAWS